MTETGEIAYRGFLGVPIIQNRKVLGVLVVRQEAQREFLDDEVTFLFTLAAQLAGAIVYAQTSGWPGFADHDVTQFTLPRRTGRQHRGVDRQRRGRPPHGRISTRYRIATATTSTPGGLVPAAVAAVEDDLRRLRTASPDRSQPKTTPFSMP